MKIDEIILKGKNDKGEDQQLELTQPFINLEQKEEKEEPYAKTDVHDMLLAAVEETAKRCRLALMVFMVSSVYVLLVYWNITSDLFSGQQACVVQMPCPAPSSQPLPSVASDPTKPAGGVPKSADEMASNSTIKPVYLPFLNTKIKRGAFEQVAPFFLVLAFIYMHLYLQELFPRLRELDNIQRSMMKENILKISDPGFYWYPWFVVINYRDRLNAQHQENYNPRNYIHLLLKAATISIIYLSGPLVFFLLGYISIESGNSEGYMISVLLIIPSFYAIHATMETVHEPLVKARNRGDNVTVPFFVNLSTSHAFLWSVIGVVCVFAFGNIWMGEKTDWLLTHLVGAPFYFALVSLAAWVSPNLLILLKLRFKWDKMAAILRSSGEMESDEFKDFFKYREQCFNDVEKLSPLLFPVSWLLNRSLKLSPLFTLKQPLRGSFSGLYLRGVDFSGFSFHQGSNFSGKSTNLWETVWLKTECRQVIFDDAKMNGADMQESILIQAQMKGTVLSWAKLNGAKLMQANLDGALLYKTDLCGADLTGADLSNADLRQVIFDSSTTWNNVTCNDKTLLPYGLVLPN